MIKEKNSVLNIEAKQINNGISIKVLSREFKIEYPGGIWPKTPAVVRQALLENVAFAETHFLPLILDKTKIKYNFNYPLLEPAFFKNQLYDLLDCEQEDRVRPLSYLKKFYNLEFEYKFPHSTIPNFSQIHKFNIKRPTVVIPFTFGKESLATFALCRELGIKPILIYCQEPVQPYEEKYKLKKLAELKKKYKIKTYFIKHQPGLFRYGQAFKKKLGTEIGWGSQTVLLSLLAIPFVYAHEARYILFGSEYLNNNAKIINGWKVYASADQTSEMSLMKNNLSRLLTNGQCEIKSSLESLEEITVFYLLHHRYPEIGRYQFSCSAEKPLYGGSQWCHACGKCSQNFLFARCCNFNFKNLGFKKDLLNESKQFKYYFKKEIKSYSIQELSFAFLWFYKKRLPSLYLSKFKKIKMSQLKTWSWYYDYFTRLKPAINLPSAYKKKMIQIFKEELQSFKELLPIK